MNPYNFVRLYPMAAAARQPAVPHSSYAREYNGQPVFSGRMTCTLTTFSPTMVLSHTPQDHTQSGEHKIFNRFFHRPDDLRPVIPASSLKGMVRAIAEAASNSCLSVIQEDHGARWPDILSSYPPSLHFCGRKEANPVVIPAGSEQPPHLCPTCRIFGTAPQQESGGNRAGLYPRAFQGKVRFSDAHLVGDGANAHDQSYTLISLLEPKLSQKVWYYDTQRGSHQYPLAGRKFYYHHDSLIPSTASKSKFNSTVRPVRPGNIFLFDVDFRNLTEYEMDLLIYALQLEPAAQLIVERELEVGPDGQRETHLVFNSDKAATASGIYPKLGYGKSAGLGSVCVLVSAMKLLDPRERYSGGDGWRTLTGDERDNQMRGTQMRIRMLYHGDQQTRITDGYLADLREILRFPNGLGPMSYPTLRDFRGYKEDGIKLPLPGQEGAWR